jgi:4'-phosphopantetheinyl transferase EntD
LTNNNQRFELALNIISPCNTAWDSKVIDSAEPRTEFLFPGENQYILNSVDKRKNEFIAGRVAARDALSKLGYSPVAIPKAKDRRPLWPNGIVGTISHSGGCAVSFVALNANYQGIGFDLEPNRVLPVGVKARILLPGESLETCLVTPFGSIDIGMLTFVIKEAIFKSLYPFTLKFLNFTDVKITLETHRLKDSHVEGECSISIFEPLTRKVVEPDKLKCCWCLIDGFLCALAYWKV